MSPCLFIVHMDGVVREVKMRTLDRGLLLKEQNGCELLFADDTALVASTEERLQRLVNEFGVVCERRKLRVNIGKSKVMVCNRRGGRAELNVRLNGELLEEVETFKYLGSVIGKGTGVSKDVRQRVSDGAAAYGAMKSVWRVKEVGMRVKKALYECIVVPTVLYGGDSWGLRKEDRDKLNVMEMNCLRNMCGVSHREQVTKRGGTEKGGGR